MILTWKSLSSTSSSGAILLTLFLFSELIDGTHCAKHNFSYEWKERKKTGKKTNFREKLDSVPMKSCANETKNASHWIGYLLQSLQWLMC